MFRSVSENTKHCKQTKCEANFQLNTAQQEGDEENNQVENKECKQVLSILIYRIIDQSDYDKGKNEVDSKLHHQFDKGVLVEPILCKHFPSCVFQ